jgi:hypothetical protein
MTTATRAASAACTLAWALGGCSGTADTADTRRQAEAAVLGFNGAFAEKDIEQIAAYLVEGGVQFELAPAHAGTPQALAQEIRAKWYGVTPILFAATGTYTRSVEILDSRVAPEMATVWARVTSRTQLSESAEPSVRAFNEVYLLVRTPQGWKIGAMINDRATDGLSMAPAQASGSGR